MRIIIFAAIALLSTIFAGCPSQSAQEKPLPDASSTPLPNGKRQPVLVELFTSEGCSSCPPADRLFADLNKNQPVANANVIALGFHVDYWDGAEWRDRFSSRDYTKRQEAYASQFKLDSTYTPQAVVDGTSEFVGSNRGQALDAIAKNAEAQKGKVDLEIAGDKISATISGLVSHTDAVVYLAVAENSLATHVGGGENSGVNLVHTAVVRDLKQIGTIAASVDQGTFELPLPTNAEWKPENTRYVVFVQENATLKVIAVDEISK